MSALRLVLMTLILVTVGQLTAGIYLPSLPHIAGYMGSDASLSQVILVIYYGCYGLSQFVYGPVSDRFGRRIVSLIGLGIFILGSSVGMLASTIYMIWLGCLLQGLGIGAAGVLARAVPRDLYQGKALVAVNSWINAAVIIMPLVAPIIGGYLQEHAGWRANFILLCVYGIGITVWFIFDFLETKDLSSTRSLNVRQALYQYKQVLGSSQFRAYIICATIAFMSVPAFEVTGTFLLQNVIGVSPVVFGWLTLIPFIGIVIGNYGAKWLVHHYSMAPLLLGGSGLMVIASLALLVFGAIGYVTILALIAPVTLFLIGAGLVIPLAVTGAMDPFANLAGTAGALLGGLQNIGGGLATAILSWLPETSQQPLGWLFLIIAFIIGGVVWLQQRKERCE